jgi:hypothetical protein
MTIADNLKRSAPKDFFEAYDELAKDERFAGRESLLPFAALAQVLVYATEKLALRTEIECKHEIYKSQGKTPPPNDQLLRHTS